MTIPPASRCPICGKPASPTARPFCSPRCAQVDLGRWLTESYRVPGAEIDEDTLDEPASDKHAGVGKGSHEAG